MARQADPANSSELPVDAKRRPGLSQQLLNWFGIGSSRAEDGTAAGDDSGDLGTQILTEGYVAAGAPALSATMAERYQIVRTLGRGATGIVYQARDLRIGRIIAIKLLYQKVPPGSLLHRRFLQEARIAGQVENPNIVTIYDAEDSLPGILMEYLGGGNLAARLKNRQPMDEETALKILRGILNGLEAAHTIGVVHRDIKPQNILFDQYGNPKISDFGIAHLPQEFGGLSEEENRQVAGTPNYMAPEQMHFDQRIDARADLYAVGVMGFEMLTGERPYQTQGARHIYQVREVIERTPMPTAADFPPAVTDGSRSMILRLMQRDPVRRYRYAREVSQSIDEALSEMVSIQVAGKVSRDRATVRVEMFEDILRLFLVDGVVSTPERRELLKRAQRLGIRDTVAHKSEEKIRRELGLPSLRDLQAYEAKTLDVLQDREFSADDREILDRMARSFNITELEQRKIEDGVMARLHMRRHESNDSDSVEE